MKKPWSCRRIVSQFFLRRECLAMRRLDLGTNGSGSSKEHEQLMDGSDIMELVGNEKVFNCYVDRKFWELDQDEDGKLSLQELEPAVADIGAVLGLPPQGSSPDSDHIYSEVRNEFTHGQERDVSKSKFKEILSDVLIGMAAGLKRDPIVILRLDGEDLRELIHSSSYEVEMVSIFSEIGGHGKSLRDCIMDALGKLTIDQGMPPTSDSWVMKNIVEPAMGSYASPVSCTNPCSQEIFLQEFRRIAQTVALRLSEKPTIVAYSGMVYDGDGIRRLLSNKHELEKALTTAVESIPSDNHRKISKNFLRLALDAIGPAAGLPPIGGVDEMDKLIEQGCQMVKADDGKLVKEDEFKKLILEILGSIMLQLEGKPISVSSNSVVHEPIPSSSSLFIPSSCHGGI